MRNVITLLLIFSSVFCFPQTENTADFSRIVCKYDVSFLKDTTNTYSMKNEIMTLLIGDNISLYKSEQKYANDSIMQNLAKNAIQEAVKNNSAKINVDLSKTPQTQIYHEVYKKADKVIIYDKVYQDKFSYDAKNKVQWELINENKVISGYHCKKAIGKYRNRFFTAWYTDDVPIPEGPYTFKGLPGLIVEIADKQEYFTFKLIELKNDSKKIVPMTNSNIISTTYAKFKKAREDAMNNPAAKLQQIMHRPITQEEIERVNNNAKRNNNFLD